MTEKPVIYGKRPKARRGRRVLITGVTSSLGRRLAGDLLEQGKADFVMGVGMGQAAPVLETAKGKGMSFLYRRLNILRNRDFANLFESDEFLSYKIDTVVHLAFLHRPELPVSKTHQLNVQGTKNLLDWCLQNPGITKFIFRSSGMVYKVRPENPAEISEEDDLNFDPGAPAIVRDEIDAELLCRAMMDNRRMKIVVLRPSAMVGPNLHTYFNTYLESAACLRISGFNPLVNLLHLDDMVRAIELAISKNVQGVFNATGKEILPLSELARLAGVRQIAVPESLAHGTNRIMRRLKLTDFDINVGMERLKFPCLMDPRKARQELGYEPVHPVRFQ